MRTFFTRILVLATALCWSAAVLAAPSTPAQLQHFFHQVHTFHAHFHQVLRDDTGATIQASSGVFTIARPGQFRWIYQKPYHQVIVSDGKTLWIYDKDLAQVTERPAGSAIHGTPAQLLSGGEGLKQAFTIEQQDQRDGLHWVKLTPKSSQSDFKWVKLGFRSGQLAAMELRDSLGETSHITFSDVQVNARVPAERFHFQVPKGVEVVR